MVFLYGHLRVRNQVICCSHRESYDSPSPNSHMINTLRLAYQCSSYSSAKMAVLQSYENDFYLTKTDSLLHQKTCSSSHRPTYCRSIRSFFLQNSSHTKFRNRLSLSKLVQSYLMMCFSGELIEPLLVSCSHPEDYQSWIFQLQQVSVFYLYTDLLFKLFNKIV